MLFPKPFQHRVLLQFLLALTLLSCTRKCVFSMGIPTNPQKREWKCSLLSTTTSACLCSAASHAKHAKYPFPF